MKKRIILTACLLLTAGLSVSGGEGPEAIDFEPWSVGTAVTTVLPQHGIRPAHRTGGAVNVGYYVDEFLAFTGEVSCFGNVNGIGVGGLWHWWGYERFDPYFTFGARGWLHGGLGPCGGVGAFYHLTDSWSLTFTADATLDLDGANGMIYTISAGVRCTF